MKTRKSLIILANGFPFGKGEAYMESEVEYLAGFDEVTLVSLKVLDQGYVRKVPQGWRVVPIRFAPKLAYLVNALLVLGDSNLYAELRRLVRNQMLTPRRVKTLFVFLSRSHLESRVISKAIRSDPRAQYVIYTYRFDYQPYLAYLLKEALFPGARLLSRAHRYDLYEDRRKDGYIPMRPFLLRELDGVRPCSEHGAAHLKGAYPEFAEKVRVAYLGTRDMGSHIGHRGCPFRIVSCSNVVPVKRLELLVQSLGRLGSAQVSWTHFGDGESMQEVRSLASNLPANVHVDLRGSTANEEILREYASSQFDLFVNVSESEGLPVSIMEAMSFGTPCLATDAGGTSELVEDGVTGAVVSVGSTPQIIAGRILGFIEMADDEYQGYRLRSRAAWERCFNAASNYTRFDEELAKLADANWRPADNAPEADGGERHV